MTYTGGYVLPGTVAEPGQSHLPAGLEQATLDQAAFWFDNRARLGLTRLWEYHGTYRQFATLDLLPSVGAVLTKYRRILLLRGRGSHRRKRRKRRTRAKASVQLTPRLGDITLLPIPAGATRSVRHVNTLIKFAANLALLAMAISSVGCSSILARNVPRETRTYPGVKRWVKSGGLSGGGGEDAMIWAFIIVTDLGLSACVDTLLLPVDLHYQPPEKRSYKGVYQGTYTWGWEQNDFVPQGGRERWWVTGHLQTSTTPAFVVVEGELSQRGYYMYGCSRELQVTKVLEVRGTSQKGTK